MISASPALTGSYDYSEVARSVHNHLHAARHLGL